MEAGTAPQGSWDKETLPVGTQVPWTEPKMNWGIGTQPFDYIAPKARGGAPIQVIQIPGVGEVAIGGDRGGSARGAAVDPLQWARDRLMALSNLTTAPGGGGGRVAPTANSVQDIIKKTGVDTAEQFRLWEEGRKADQMRRGETIKAEKPLTAYNSTDAYAAMDKSTAQPVGRSRLDVASGFLPVWDNSKNGFDFTGAMTRGQAGAQQNIENLRADKLTRQADIMRQLGFGRQDMEGVNAVNADANNRAGRLGETLNMDQDIAKLRIGELARSGGALQSAEQHRADQEFQAREHAANRAASAANARLGSPESQARELERMQLQALVKGDISVEGYKRARGCRPCAGVG